jgi:excisionase family DNA binding protein
LPRSIARRKIARGCEVADRLGLTVETILRWTRRGDLPAFKLGAAVRYREVELAAWLEAHATADTTNRGSPDTRSRVRHSGPYALPLPAPDTSPHDDAARTEEDP